MNKKCELCVKRKTMYCPNSSKCMATENKPYYQNLVMLLEENKELKKMCELYSKSLYNAELKQLKQEKENLIKYLEDRIVTIHIDINGLYSSVIYGYSEACKDILKKVKEGKYEKKL